MRSDFFSSERSSESDKSNSEEKKTMETKGQEVQEESSQDVQDANGMISQWVETVVAKTSEKSDTM